MGRRQAIHGFTLVEVMVAIVIFLIFIGSVYGVFRAANQSMQAAEEKTDIYQTGRVLLAQMNTELTDAYQPATSQTSELVGEDSEGASDEQQEDTLTFLTTGHQAPSGQTAGDVCRVTYRMADASQDEEPGLYIEENFHPGLEMEDEEPTARLLSPLVVGFNVRYLPVNATDWLTEWTAEQTTLPIAVRIELTLQSGEKGAKPMILLTTANPAMVTAPADGGDDAQE